MNDFPQKLGPTVDDLVECARAAGEENASRQTINRWVSKGWVLRPRQQARKWRYPNAAMGQVDTVARLRARGVHEDFFRFALYVEAGTGDHEEARAFALRYLALWKQAVDTFAGRFADDPDSLRAEAATAARRRGKNSPLPHRVRMTLDERTMAMQFTAAQLFSSAPAPEDMEAGQHQLERLLGLRSGRGGATRDLSEIALSPSDWPLDVDGLVRAVEAASAERLEFARRGIELAVMWMPALRSAFADMLGAAASVALVDVISEWEQMITPDMYSLLFAIFVKNGMDRASDEQIEQSLDDFQPAVAFAAILRELPSSDRPVAIRRLRAYPRLLLGDAER